MLVFSAISFLGSINLCLGQDLITLCTESVAKQLKKEGVFVTTKSYDPQKKDYWIQYRKVLKIERVAMGANGGDPIYYFVHYGPESSYKYWKKGMVAPWNIKEEY